VESDITPLRWRVARVVHKSLGVDPADLPIETRFMVSVVHLFIIIFNSLHDRT
jgi:hypothetical protein